MRSTQAIVHSAIIGVLTLSMNGAAMAAEKPQGEKCYGIAKAGKNDCQTASSACAGSAKQDSEPSAFIFVPTGTCEKIAGGSLKPKA